MQFQIFINSIDVSANADLTRCSINRELNGAIGTASFTLVVDAEIGARYGFARYGEARYSTIGSIDLLNAVEIIEYGSSPVNTLFSGYAIKVSYDRLSDERDEWTFECQDHTLLLDTVMVTETYTDKTDQYIIQDAFGALGEVGTSNVDEIQTLASFDVKDLTLRRLMEQIAEITGAIWYLTPDKELYYAATYFAAAPFAVSDTPDTSNLLTYPQDITNEVWQVADATKDSATLLTFTAPWGRLQQVISTSDGARYTLSFRARRVTGNSEMYFFSYYSASGNTPSPLTLTDEFVHYSVTVLGRSGGGVVAFGIIDINGSGQGQIEVTDWQVTDVSDYTYILDSYSKDDTHVANRVTCLGALDPDDGTELSVTVNDTDHQTAVGRIFAKPLTNRSITNLDVLTLWANYELSARIVPKERGDLTVTRDGLDVGQGLTITSTPFSISGTYIIQSISISKETATTVKYSVTFGDRDPALVARLRQYNVAASATTIAQAIPPDGTVGDSKLDRTTDPVVITGADIKAATIEASNIKAATITATEIANATITTTQISGTAGITGAQIASATIEAGNIKGATITAAEIKNATITTTQISGTAAITGSQIAASTITASNIANATITSNEIALATISGGNIAAATITGDNIALATIAAANIANATITATQIANLTITASQIANLTITAGQIANATITSAKINDLAVSKITGWDGGTVDFGASGVAFTGAGGAVFSGPVTSLGAIGASGNIAAPAATVEGNYVKANAAFQRGSNTGASGSFTTVDSKTVTVDGGIITAIV